MARAGLRWESGQKMSPRMMRIGDEEESGETEADGIWESRKLIVNWTGIYDIILSVEWMETDEQRTLSPVTQPQSNQSM